MHTALTIAGVLVLAFAMGVGVSMGCAFADWIIDQIGKPKLRGIKGGKAS